MSIVRGASGTNGCQTQLFDVESGSALTAKNLQSLAVTVFSCASRHIDVG